MGRMFGGIGGAVIGLITGAVLAANKGDGLSIPPQGNDWIFIVPSVLIFTVLGVVFYKIFGFIFDKILNLDFS